MKNILINFVAITEKKKYIYMYLYRNLSLSHSHQLILQKLKEIMELFKFYF